MRSVTKAVIAGAAGLALLAGGAGSLAYWTDTKTGSSVVISSGDLSLGSIADGTGWKIQQNASGVSPAQASSATYVPGTTLVVPGDVLTNTISVPVSVTGLNNKATLVVTGAAGTSNALSTALVPTIVSVNGVSGNTATITPATTSPVSVMVSITIPWSSTVDNTTKNLSTSYTLSYTLTQVAAATP